jgi:hypothetical protein
MDFYTNTCLIAGHPATGKMRNGGRTSNVVITPVRRLTPRSGKVEWEVRIGSGSSKAVIQVH